MHREQMLVYKLFYKIAKFAVGKLAQNPELQAKTASFAKERIVPEAKARWRKTKPRFEQARDTAIRAVKDVNDGPRENDPKDHTKKFLSEVSKRLRDRVKQ